MNLNIWIPVHYPPIWVETWPFASMWYTIKTAKITIKSTNLYRKFYFLCASKNYFSTKAKRVSSFSLASQSKHTFLIAEIHLWHFKSKAQVKRSNSNQMLNRSCRNNFHRCFLLLLPNAVIYVYISKINTVGLTWLRYISLIYKNKKSLLSLHLFVKVTIWCLQLR